LSYRAICRTDEIRAKSGVTAGRPQNA